MFKEKYVDLTTNTITVDDSKTAVLADIKAHGI
jgi:hypothetical protein